MYERIFHIQENPIQEEVGKTARIQREVRSTFNLMEKFRLIRVCACFEIDWRAEKDSAFYARSPHEHIFEPLAFC